MTKEAPPSARRLLQAMGFAVPATGKGQVESIRDVGSDLQAVRRGAEEMTAKSAEREVRFSKRNLKLQLLSESAVRAGHLQKHFDSRTKELESAERD